MISPRSASLVHALSPRPTRRSKSASGPAVTLTARFAISGRLIECDFNGCRHAGGARRRIATSLGTAVARVEIFVAGKVLEDGDILFLDGHEMEIVLSERRVEQEFLKAVGALNFKILRSQSSLRIRRTQLSTLPEIFCHLRDLRHLDIYDAWLCDLPDDIGQLSELQTLRITHTMLSTLPESIGQLQQLNSLDLSSNKLTTLPNTLGQLVWLSELNLGNNVLTELPEKFAKLQGLHHLDLRFNWLTTLPDNIGLLTWVRMVNVDVNRLTRLP